MSDETKDEDPKEKKEIVLDGDQEEMEVVLTFKNGERRTFTIRELTGTEYGKYRTSVRNRIAVNDAGMPTSIKDFKGLESSLICLCLYENGKRVAQSVIDEWGAKTLQQLFELCHKVNGMDEKSEKAAKNG
jgi:hypothetical protein